MRTVSAQEAENQLSALLDAVEAGEEVVIAREGRAVARLVTAKTPSPLRRLGSLVGKLNVPDDFDDPLPDDLQALFDTRHDG